MRRKIATLLGVSVLAFLLTLAGARKVNVVQAAGGSLPVPLCGPDDPPPCPK